MQKWEGWASHFQVALLVSKVGFNCRCMTHQLKADSSAEAREYNVTRVLLPGSGSSYLYFNARPLVHEGEPVVVTWNYTFKHSLDLEENNRLHEQEWQESKKICANVIKVKSTREGKLTLWAIYYWQGWVWVTVFYYVTVVYSY